MEIIRNLEEIKGKKKKAAAVSTPETQAESGRIVSDDSIKTEEKTRRKNLRAFFILGAFEA